MSTNEREGWGLSPLRRPFLVNALRERIILGRAARLLGAPPASRPRTPVVLVPGILGSRLTLPGLRRPLWGDLPALYAPPGGGDALWLGPDGGEPQDVRPGELLEGITIVPGLCEIPVYRDLVRFLIGVLGYQVDRPGQPGTLFGFAYDFRRDLSASITLLAQFLEGVREKTGRGELHLVAHSYGGLLASCLARRSAPTPSQGTRVRAVVLLSTAFGGAIDNLRVMAEGHRPAPGGFLFAPELCAASGSTALTLPSPGVPCLVDACGRDLPIDVYDVGEWKRHGLGVFSEQALARLVARARRRGEANPLLAASGWRRWLAGALAEGLERARRLHEELARPPATPVPPHVVIGGQDMPTPVRAVLAGAHGARRCIVPSERQARRWFGASAARRMFVPGDGEVPADRLAPWNGSDGWVATFVKGTHCHVINSAAALSAVGRALIRVGADEA